MRKLMFIVAMSVAMISCSKNNKNLNPIANAKAAVENKDVDGKTFVSSCQTSFARGIATFLQTWGQATAKSWNEAYGFNGVNITHSTRYYSTGDCSGDQMFSFIEEGTYKRDHKNGTNDGAQNLDLDYSTLSAKVATPTGVQAANATSLCGKNDWVAGKKVDVTAKSKDTTCYGAQVPRQLMNEMKVDGSTLLLGSSPGQPAGSSYPSTVTNKFESK